MPRICAKDWEKSPAASCSRFLFILANVNAANFDRGACAPALALATEGREEAMKPNYKIAAAVIGSFLLGLGAASVLHAQAKPLAYTFAEIDVKDQDGYTKDFFAQGASQHQRSRRQIPRR